MTRPVRCSVRSSLYVTALQLLFAIDMELIPTQKTAPLVGAWAALFFLTGCASTAVSHAPTSESVTAQPYKSSLNGNLPKIGFSGWCKQPEYPRASLDHKEEGTVVTQLTIDVDGRVVDGYVEKSSGFVNLDNATLQAWSLCKFEPAIRDGSHVKSKLRMTYIWKLQ